MKASKSLALSIACGVLLVTAARVAARQDPGGRRFAAGESGGAMQLAASPDARQARTGQDVKASWDTIRNFLRQGAYQDALQELDDILVITPNDPWAQLYHALCELRLQSTQTFPKFSPEQLASLKAQLHDEERLQRRSAVQHRALERQLKREQARWDRELVALQQQGERDARQKDRQSRLSAQQHTREARAQQQVQATAAREQAPPAKGEAAPPAGGQPEGQAAAGPSAEEAAPSPEAPTEGTQEPAPSVRLPTEPVEPAGPSVELSPVVVATPPARREALTPSLIGRPRPPKGAVQINAIQMSVSPDRKIAIADGDVEIVFENALLTCDHLTLFTDTKDVYAEGRVRLEEGNQVFRGEMVHYNFETKKGRFLQGTVSSPPWHEYGRSIEHIAEGVFEVTPGYITSCELEPPHFKFYGRRAIFFSGDKSARISNAAVFVERVPFLYLPFISLADRKMPFFIIPGKNKQWGPFALAGYRYEVPPLPGGGTQKGTVKMDYRRYFLWAFGLDHEINSPQLGKGLLRLYYNRKQNQQRPKEELPKGADADRYRLMWRHRWNPLPDTTVVTDIQKFSDKDFRREFLYREEFTNDDLPESFISSVTNTPEYTLGALVKKRINRFQTVKEAQPQLTLDVRPQRIGETPLFSETKLDFANFLTKQANSESDTDVIRLDWFEQLKYAVSLFRPIEVTPRAGLRETFYTKDIQGADREGQRDLFSGQFTAGIDSSLKLFRIFPVTTNALGLNIHGLRHVITPTVSYAYAHRPTVQNELLNFTAAASPESAVTFGLENKLQTRRPNAKGKLENADLMRLLFSAPYTFRSNGNKRGGRLGDFLVDLETYPWPWMRLESDVTVPSHFPSTRDGRITRANVDLVFVGGRPDAQAQTAPPIQGVQAPAIKTFQPGRLGGINMMPQGQWYFGLGQRFSQNDKTESVMQVDWRLSDKWQVGTFQRFTWKEVVGEAKRFYDRREQQYTLRRDLHDWIGELVYRVDREYGEEIFFTLTLKAYPDMPIELENSYHQPKLGSQSSPFSPIRVQ